MGKEKVSITIENPMINITGTMNIDLVVKIKNNMDINLETLLIKEERNPYISWISESKEMVLGKLDKGESTTVLLPVSIVNLPEVINNPFNIKTDSGYLVEYQNVYPPIKFNIRGEYSYLKNNEMSMDFAYSNSILLGNVSVATTRGYFSQIIELSCDEKTIEYVNNVAVEEEIKGMDKKKEIKGKGKIEIEGNLKITIDYKVINQEKLKRVINNINFKKKVFVPSDFELDERSLKIEFNLLSMTHVIDNLFNLEGILVIVTNGYSRGIIDEKINSKSK